MPWFPVFTSPPLLDLSAAALPIPPPSRQFSPQGHLVLQASCHTGIPTPVTCPCTGYQLLLTCPICDPEGCFLSALWLHTQSGPANQWAALPASGFSYISPGDLNPSLGEGPTSKFVLAWLLPLGTIQFVCLFACFIAYSYSCIIVSQFFISNFTCWNHCVIVSLGWIHAATVLLSHPVILLVLTIANLFVNIFLNISLFYVTVSTNRTGTMSFLYVFPEFSIMPGS